MTAPGPERGPIRVLYFAWLRDRVGRAEESLTLPGHVTDVTGLRIWLAGSSAGHHAAFEHAALIRCAVNQQIVGPEHPIAPGDEVAFFPPVTGG